MQGLCYSALDIAVIVSSMQLGCRDESRILDRIWEGEKAFLDIPYRANQRKFILDTYHWLQYFYDKPVIDKEFPAIQKDLAYSNRTLQADQLTSDFSDLDLVFQSIRIRILYGYGNDYVRIKLRTLLKQYGYKRRSQLLASTHQPMYAVLSSGSDVAWWRAVLYRRCRFGSDAEHFE